MKKVIFLLLISTFCINSQPWMENLPNENQSKFDKVVSSFNEYFETREPVKGSGWKQFKRYEEFWKERAGESGIVPSAREILNEWNKYNQKKAGSAVLADEADWKLWGPVSVPRNEITYQSAGIGRINIVEFHPANHQVIWAGSSAGGAWKSTNNGATWEAVPITQYLAVGVTDIAISKSHTNFMYMATGDGNGYSMSRNFSMGILKSVDGGETWEYTSKIHEFEDQLLYNRLLIHPDNPNIVWVASNVGILKTTDGGQKWNLVSDKLHFRDLEFKPGDPNVIYAGTYGNGDAYRSTDGGDSFQDLNITQNSNRVAIAVTESNPKVVYALCSRSGTSSFNALFKSTDSGDNWQLMSSSPNILGISPEGASGSGLGWYALAFTVSPQNENFVFAGSVNSWYSNDGGKTWKLMTHWQGRFGAPFIHADQHFFTFQPETNLLYSANDGGIYRSSDLLDWETISHGISVNQMYRIGSSQSSPHVISGSQDNGTNLYDGNSWSHVLGADGMSCLVSYDNPDVMFASYQSGSVYRSLDGGENFSFIYSAQQAQENSVWVTEVEQDPLEPNTIYLGYRNIFKSVHNGAQFTKISNFSGGSNPINVIKISPFNNDYIYVCRWSMIFKTSDGGDSWDELYDSQQTITDIEIDPLNPDRIWFTKSGYIDGQKVFEYKDGEITNISGTLPNVPVNTIVYLKESEDKLFIGTDLGVFYRDKFMKDWVPFNQGMPNVVISELEVQYQTGKLLAGTFARGLWATDFKNCKIDEPVLSVYGSLEFCEGDSVVITVANDFSNYKWNTGDTTSSIVVKESGSFNVTVQNEDGCTAYSETLNSVMNPAPDVSISANKLSPFCIGDTVKLYTPSIGYAEFTWNNNEEGRELFIIEAGEYFVTGLTSAGCVKASNTIEAEFLPKTEVPVIKVYKSKLIAPDADEYLWMHNGKIIKGAFEKELELFDTGGYRVAVRRGGSCFTLSPEVDVLTSIDDLSSDNSLKVIPQPASDYIDLLTYKKIFSIEIYDSRGLLVFGQGHNNKNNLRIDTSAFSTGVYIIVANVSGEMHIEKFIKE